MYTPIPNPMFNPRPQHVHNTRLFLIFLGTEIVLLLLFGILLVALSDVTVLARVVGVILLISCIPIAYMMYNTRSAQEFAQYVGVCPRR